MQSKLVFFIDVDNTLLDNDHIKSEIKVSLVKVFGKKDADHFWAHHDGFRDYQKYVDFPNIIRGYCQELHGDKCQMEFTQVFNSIEFKHALYPKVSLVLKYLRSLGKVALFTEGDVVYQRRKVEKSGLSGLVDQVFLYEHKMNHLAKIVAKFKEFRLIFIDDRAEYLSEEKRKYPQIYTINVAQGHYAKQDRAHYFKGIDKTVSAVGELKDLKFEN